MLPNVCKVSAFRLVILLMTSLFPDLPLGVSQVGSSTVVVAPRSVPGTVAKHDPSDGSQGAPPPTVPDTLVNSRKKINGEIELVAKSFQRATEKARTAELLILLALSEYMIYGGHEKAHCDKLVQWLPQIFGQVPSLCQLLEGTVSKDLQAKFQSEAFQVRFQSKYAFTDWKEELLGGVLPEEYLLVREMETATAEKATMLENARKVASILEGDREGDGTFLYFTTVISLYLYYIPKSLMKLLEEDLSDLLKDSSLVDNLPKVVPPNGQPTVLNLGKLLDGKIEELAQGIRSLPDESERRFHLQTLLCLSEYMIYGGHERENCYKLLNWMYKIFGRDATLCQSIEGDISKDLHGKFQSQAYQVLFKQKYDFTQLTDNLSAKPSLWKEIAIAEKSTVLENARRLASMIDTKGDGYSLYAISVLHTYGNILEASDKKNSADIGKVNGKVKGGGLPALVAKHPKDSHANIPKNSLKDNSKYNLPDTGQGKGKVKGGGGVSAWVAEHPKYSAGSLVAGGLALGGLLSLFQLSEEKQDTHTWKVTETKEETFLAGTVQEEATADVPLLVLAVACCLAVIGALAFACYAYYARARPNGQQAEVSTESTKGKTAKQSEKKAKKVPIKSAKTGASSKSVSASSPATGQTST